MDIPDPDAAPLDIAKRIRCPHCATTWTVRITQDKPWIEERHVVVPKIVEEQPKISKSSKRIPKSQKGPHWTESEWLKYNMEPKIGYTYNRFEDMWYCDACDKPFSKEWSCWCHIVAKEECQYREVVRTAVEKYNKSKNTST